MLKKFFIILISILLMIGMCGIVYAKDLQTELNIIQKASETKYLEKDQGYISKTIVDSNANTGEVTIELKLSNTKKESSTEKPTEIFLVVDNSPSMDFVTTTGETRKKVVLDSASELVESIFSVSSNVKMGLIDFHGYYYSGANISDATVRQGLTDNKDTMLSAISSQMSRSTYSGTNIQAGLLRAKQNFSNNTENKIVILLTDGVPNADINGNYEHGDITSEKGVSIQNATKQTLLELKASGIYTIVMLSGLDEADAQSTDTNTLEEQLQAISRVFGTVENPTSDKYYFAKDSNIKNIINQDILNNVTEKIQNPINTVKIVDYFPDDITNNFEFSYIGNASTGTRTDSIDEETKTITWDIGTLKGDEVATLRYKLKIKDMKNTELLNKTIATNEKVVLTYKDIDSEDYTVTLTSSPKIQLSEVKEELTATVSYDPTSNTTGNVTATIKTNKKVNEVDGWTLSDDGKTLTKKYSTNATEIVHLVDLDGMTKDVEVIIGNIITETKESNENGTNTNIDNSVAPGRLPNTGVSMAIVLSAIIVSLIALVFYKQYNKFKDIK